jgi:hypothetical protein
MKSCRCLNVQMVCSGQPPVLAEPWHAASFLVKDENIALTLSLKITLLKVGEEALEMQFGIGL